MNIRSHTKAGVAKTKRNGVKLGTNYPMLALKSKRVMIAFAKKMNPIIEELKTQGFVSIRDIEKVLKIRKIKTPQVKT